MLIKLQNTLSVWWITKICVALMVAIFLLRGWVEAITLPNFELEYYREFQAHLSQKDFKGYKTRQVIRKDPFSIVTLSNMAVGMMNLSKKNSVPKADLLPLIDEIRSRAISEYVRPYPTLTVDTDLTTGGAYGLYLSHLNLILGIHQALHQSTEPDPLHTKISQTLHDVSSKENRYHTPSFANGDQWPADQSVTLLSLYLYDQLNHSHFSDEPIRGWLDYMHQNMIDGETGLYKSSLTERWYMDIPRGDSMSWELFYMSQFAPQEAADLYQKYRSVMWKEFWGIGGFRQWPVGRGREMNRDTGPIIADIGASATALSIGSTQLMGDTHHHTLINRMFFLLGIQHFSPLVGKAILFAGETATFWFNSRPLTQYDETPANDLFLLTIYFLAVVVLCASILWTDVVIRRLMRKKARKS